MGEKDKQFVGLIYRRSSARLQVLDVDPSVQVDKETTHGHNEKEH
jgi:hypothetical protein